MKLFFKHLLVSIKRKPLQPFILILTLTISAFVCIVSLSLKDSLTREANASLNEQYGSADIAITLNGESKSRFMFTSRVSSLLGDRARVCGTYELVLSGDSQDSVIFGAAADLYEINSMFDFRFTSYGRVTEQDLASTAFISEELAREKGLNIGDSLEVKLFSQDVTYTVGGISPTKYLGKYNILVDICGVVDVLAKNSIIASVIGEDFKPCSTVFVDIAEGSSAVECVEILKASPDFAEKTYTDVEVLLKSQSNTDVLNIAIDFSVVLICLLAMAITFCCFFILADERQCENISFQIAGASSAKLNLMLLAEITVYWALGSALGIMLSAITLKPFAEYIGIRYALPRLSLGVVALSMLIMLVSSYVTAGMFILTRGKKQKTGDKGWLLALFALITVALMVTELIVKPSLRLYFGILACVAAIFSTFALTPVLLKHIMAFVNVRLDKRAEKGQAINAPLRYAVKNICSIRVLHNVSRLGAVLTAIIVLTLTVMASAHSNMKLARSVFSEEYAVIGATEGCKEHILECGEIEDIDNVYFSAATLENGTNSMIVSVQRLDTLSRSFGVSVLPQGNEAVISHSIARSLSLEVGDSFLVSCGNKPLELRVKEITRASMMFILFDCEDMGVYSNLVIPIGKQNVTSSEMLMAVSTAIAEDVATALPVAELMDEKTQTLNIYITCGDILLLIAVAFSVIGLIDSLYNSYRARREEFSLFATSGMSRGEILRLKIFEICITLLIGIVIGLICILIALPFVNEGMVCAGNDVMAAFIK